MGRPQKFRHSLEALNDPPIAEKLGRLVLDIERLREKRKQLDDQIAAAFDAVDDAGFDKKFVRKVIALRAKDGDVRRDEEDGIEAYEFAVEKGVSLAHVRRNAVSAEAIDPETGEFLDDRTDNATASVVAPSDERETGRETAADEDRAGANAGGGYVDSSAERAGSGNQTSDTYPLAAQVEPRNSVDNADCASGPDARATNSPATADEMDRATESSLETGSEAAENARKAVPETEDGSVSHAGAGESPAINSIGKPKYVLRPHCLSPGETCGGYSDKHCHACTVAMRKREQAEEFA
ncbi:DUF2312 domain-containing protein [Sinorhizobium medicae]|uniref:GapR family DNA-binding domain-containing protein n=1 Tax=Sinorhizobium medicae TaxID=110321 RepID=UPI002AF6A52F|nr:GapR family DNA-binding domain-containing protein [Sinorhizobium medicae]WQO53835.1 DUF2312 domain-containing protein [Sinorhizobium medicae]